MFPTPAIIDLPSYPPIHPFPSVWLQILNPLLDGGWWYSIIRVLNFYAPILTISPQNRHTCHILYEDAPCPLRQPNNSTQTTQTVLTHFWFSFFFFFLSLSFSPRDVYLCVPPDCRIRIRPPTLLMEGCCLVPPARSVPPFEHWLWVPPIKSRPPTTA